MNQITPSNNSDKKTDCNEDLWKHVYNPQRLKVLSDCISAIGTVVQVSKESDGDLHIQLKLNQNEMGLLNQKNYSNANGNLIAEIICMNKISQSDAVQPCLNCPMNINVPNVGDEILVQGTYVVDLHHGWNEIHPVSSIKIIEHHSPEIFDSNPIVGYTSKHQPIFQSEKGAHYHYSKNGNKVYEKKSH